LHNSDTDANGNAKPDAYASDTDTNSYTAAHAAGTI
jgi:hypothetical protein